MSLFQSDIGAGGMGGADLQMEGGSAARMGQQLIEEEKRLIDKVFNIIDRDKSGTIETDELTLMLKDMGFEAKQTEAVEKIMMNVDKDHDGKIGRQEFYDLLSAKLGPDDSDQEINAVFKQFARKDPLKIDVDDLGLVAKQLGDQMDYAELKAMIKEFAKESKEGLYITKDEFVEIMRMRIVDNEQPEGLMATPSGMLPM